jgi:hypothetical protein
MAAIMADKANLSSTATGRVSPIFSSTPQARQIGGQVYALIATETQIAFDVQMRSSIVVRKLDTSASLSQALSVRRPCHFTTSKTVYVCSNSAGDRC